MAKQTFSEALDNLRAAMAYAIVIVAARIHPPLFGELVDTTTEQVLKRIERLHKRSGL